MNKTAQEKEPKTSPATSAQEPSSATNPGGAINADWPGFQAYSPIPPHGFLASSPQAPPYMWGFSILCLPMLEIGAIFMTRFNLGQGSYPFSPFAMPSPNGIVEASGNSPGNIEADSKPSDVKEKLPIKRSKGSLGSLNMITGKNNNLGKESGASANGANSRSAESGSEGTSEGSDENSQNDSQLNSGGEGEASQNGNSAHGPQNGDPNTMVTTAMPVVPIPTAVATTAVPGPTTNLHIGMDYWGSPASSTIPAVHGKVPATQVVGGIVTPASRDSVQSQLWLQDERELKRQRRKQSNRESARRSRLRKQAECDELAQRAEALKEENVNLRSEANRIKNEYEQLLAENTSLKERLGEIPGHDDTKSDRKDQHRNNDKHTEHVQGQGQGQGQGNQ